MEGYDANGAPVEARTVDLTWHEGTVEHHEQFVPKSDHDAAVSRLEETDRLRCEELFYVREKHGNALLEVQRLSEQLAAAKRECEVLLEQKEELRRMRTSLIDELEIACSERDRAIQNRLLCERAVECDSIAAAIAAERERCERMEAALRKIECGYNNGTMESGTISREDMRHYARVALAPAGEGEKNG